MPAVVFWNTEVPPKFIVIAKRGLARAAVEIRNEMVELVSDPGPPPSSPGQPPRVSTGDLRASIAAVEFDGGMRQRIGPTLPGGAFAHMLEFGTVNMAPRPFVLPAFDLVRPRITKMVAKG